MNSNAVLLTKAFIQSGINNILHARPVNTLIRGGLFSLGILFAYGLYLFFARVFRLVIIQGDIGFLLIDKMFSILFLMILSLLVFSSMLSSLSVLFTSSEPEFLISLPIKSFDRYFYQTFKNTIISSWYMIILGYPIFLAYGTVYEQSLFYFILSFIIISMFAFVSSNIGITITTFIIRLLPTRRIKQIFLLMGLFSIVYIITFFRMSRPERLYSSVGIYEFLLMLQNARIPQNPYFPNDIASELIAKYEYMTGGLVAFNIFKLSLYAVIVFFLGFIVHHFFYKKSFIKFSINKASKTNYISRTIFTRLKPYRSIIFKDILHFTREVEQWSQIFILLSLIVIYIINLKNIPIISDPIRDTIVLLNISFIGFIIAAVTLRFGFPLYSLEGRYRWVLIKSSVNKTSILISKLLFSLIPSLLMSAVLTILSNLFLQVDYILIIYIFLINLIIAFNISFIGTSLGMIFPKFDTENPMQISMSIGGLLFMIISMSYVFLINYIIIRLFSRFYRFVPDIDHFINTSKFLKMPFIIGNLSIIIISAFIFLVFYYIISKKPLK